MQSYKKLIVPLMLLCILLSACFRPQSNSNAPAQRRPPDVTATGVIWYVEAGAAAPGDGSAEAPFRDLKAAIAHAAPGDTLYVKGSSPLTGSFRLKDGQRLIGAATGLGLPLLRGAGGPALDLAYSNEIAGLRIVSPEGPAIVGVDFGELRLTDLHIEGAAGLGIDLANTSGWDATVTVSNVSVSGSRAGGFQLLADSSGSTGLTLTGSSFTGNDGNAVQLTYLGTGIHSFDISGNPAIVTDGDSGIRVFIAGDSSQRIDGRIAANTVEIAGDYSAGNGISVALEGDARGAMLVEGNEVSGYGSFGIDISAREGGGYLAATVTGNRVDDPSPQALSGMSFRAGNGTDGERNTLCVDLSGNVSEGGPQGYGFERLQLPGTVHQLQGFGGDGYAPQSVASFTGSGNEGSFATLGQGAVVQYSHAVCETPRF